MKIEVLGTGCMKCKRLEQNVRQAVAESTVKADIVKVQDLQAIIDRGVMTPPALIIDGRVAAAGRVPGVDEIRKMIAGAK